MLSADISADLSAFKVQFYGDWLFAFAGSLSNADLIMEEIRQEVVKDASVLSRGKIQSTLRRAYKKRQSAWVTDRNLAPYDMDMGEFKKEGQNIFGEKLFGELDHVMRSDLVNFNEYVIVTGWGKAELSAMIYKMTPDGAVSASLDGFTAIGSGANVATNVLMSLGCTRDAPVEFALYAVAAAKFSAESCDGVGESTVLLVTHKRRPDDALGTSPVQIVQPNEVNELRKLWETYSKPRFPEEAVTKLCDIAKKVVGEVSAEAGIRGMIHAVNSAIQQP